MKSKTTTRRGWMLLCLCTTLLTAACAMDPRDEFAEVDDLTPIDVAPMGGEALFQRKGELERGLRDMVVFRDTLESMRNRGDLRGIVAIQGFMSSYMANHLDPLLAPEWQSSHPEMILADVNLRFIQGETLVLLGHNGWTDDVVDEIVRRYKRRGNMLVDYPTGQQNTLREALRILREQEWRG